MKKIIYILLPLMFVLTISKAQTIPNAGFETWTSMTGYDLPTGWDNLNTKTNSMSMYTCTKGTPGDPGTAYLKLTSKTIGANVVPGIAVCGVLDTATMQPVSGFAYSMRPLHFTGNWQHMIFGSSQGSVSAVLTRWDTGLGQRVTVATANQTLSGMAMSWAAFSINFTYMDSNNPDTCIIVLMASGMTPTNNDYLWVDNLAFSGFTGIQEIGLNTPISIYPNPATDNLILDLSSIKGKNVSIEIFDIDGKMIRSFLQIEATAKTTLKIEDISKGNYLLKVITNEGTISNKFVKL